MNKFKLFVIAAMAALVVGCGEVVEIPAAHVAKIMGKEGYREGFIPTSKIRLDKCWAYCDKLVLLNVGDFAKTERMELFMPKDKLNMTFDIRMTLAVKPQSYDELFGKIPPTQTEIGDKIILETAYVTYAQQIIRAEAREFLSTFSIAEVASSREAINTQLSERLSASIGKQTPFAVRYMGLADIAFPQIIVTAQENAAERREMIDQENAQLEVSQVRLERELQEQQLRRKVEVEKAHSEAEVNEILAKSMTSAYLRYREMNALDAIAASDNKVFVPTRMLDSISGQVMLGK